MLSSRKDHWENIYKTKDHNKVGWYQACPEISLKLLSEIDAKPTQSIIDVGCGASLLADHLIKQGFRDITLIDLSAEALSSIRNRLGDKGSIPEYLSEDITEATFTKSFDIWHDRAVFHFLTNANDRKNYMSNMAKKLSDNGRAIIGTYSLDGPVKCSGLDIVQYDEAKMSLEFVGDLELEYSITSTHETPSGGEQEYIYFIIKHKSV
jgi:2-polyprenyl-3-methyl-5-hydroxy-6-metoxy-1,4-benzoquinol methylase